MECIETRITSSGLFALYYEEIEQGQHRSLIFHSTLSEPATLVADLDMWIVSMWCNKDDKLFVASWDGEIFTVSADVSSIGFCELFGVIGLGGFDDKPLFLFGEEGELFRSTGDDWQKIKFRGDVDIYSVSQQDRDKYVFSCSNGKLLTLENSISVIDLPTNVDLHGIAHIDQNHGCVVGEMGALFLYDNGSWEDASQNYGTIHDVVALRDRYYFSTSEGGLRTINTMGETELIFEKPTYYLSEKNDRIGTFTDDMLVIFDGKAPIEQSHDSVLSTISM